MPDNREPIQPALAADPAAYLRSQQWAVALDAEAAASIELVARAIEGMALYYQLWAPRDAPSWAQLTDHNRQRYIERARTHVSAKHLVEAEDGSGDMMDPAVGVYAERLRTNGWAKTGPGRAVHYWRRTGDPGKPWVSACDRIWLRESPWRLKGRRCSKCLDVMGREW